MSNGCSDIVSLVAPKIALGDQKGALGSLDAILDCPGLSWPVLDCLGLSWALLGSSWTLLVSLGPLGLSWGLLCSLGLPWAFLGCSGNSGAHMGSPGLSWAVWGCLGLSWARLAVLGPPGHIRLPSGVAAFPLARRSVR